MSFYRIGPVTNPLIMVDLMSEITLNGSKTYVNKQRYTYTHTPNKIL